MSLASRPLRSFGAWRRMPRMSSWVLYETSQLMPSSAFMVLLRVLSDTPRRTFEPLEGFERTNSRRDFRWILTMPAYHLVRYFKAEETGAEIDLPSDISFAFSRAWAALLNGEKLTSDTIFPNFARSFIES